MVNTMISPVNTATQRRSVVRLHMFEQPVENLRRIVTQP